VDVTADTASSYTVPGQYVQVRPAPSSDGSEDDEVKPIFLAIASPPPPKVEQTEEADAAAGGGATTLEFLIKKTDDNSWITDASTSTTVDVSQVLGKGFSTAEELDGFKYDFPTQNVLLFASGSGIAPLRSAIESGNLAIGEGGSRTCRLYYGVTTPEDMSYADKFEEWEKMGVEVVPVVSRPEESNGGDDKWGGRTGYVQNALEEDGVPIARNSGALLCGVKGMTEAVGDDLKKAGVFEGRVLFNF